MVVFAVRTLDKPQEKQSPWRMVVQGILVLYVAWMAYNSLRETRQDWMGIIIAVVVLIGLAKQFHNFLNATRPSPWAMIEVRRDSLSLFGRDSSFYQLPLPKSYILFMNRQVVLRWGRSAPKRCRRVVFRSKQDLTETDFQGLQKILQEVAPKGKSLEAFTPA
jgi:hypothetical protein